MDNATTQYGDWLISYNPPPIPVRNCDWQFCHKDFDGAEDAGDMRYGHAGSKLAAMDEIDDLVEDYFNCGSCGLESPSVCAVRSCAHRDEAMQRAWLRAAALVTDALRVQREGAI